MHITHHRLFQRKETRMRLSSSGRMSSGYPRWVIVLLVIVVACMALSVDAAKEKRGRKRKQALEPMDNETGSNNELVTGACHKVALRRCGQNFMKIFNLVDYLDGMDHYNAQCALRKAFFACLEKVRQKPCRRRRQLAPIDEKKFTDKLSEAIWATRVCVLGIQRVDEIPSTRQLVSSHSQKRPSQRQ
ncbi:uncharacterized protein LOC111246802 isoform X1 [Varroa destructor]|uniref:Uncharacterized protein n=2 Tax=Varroa destructor TaxID=109461 RepID=A0A7M7JIN5_VARDE|nr:uncharacterized protein LOC111246802 isoform X1 [Varroa destructor]XP_022652724.1 uncharacterized protein LOC111246802 isoform X1 [Varroa destructor]